MAFFVPFQYSLVKTCLRKWKGVPKRPKMCLRDTSMVPKRCQWKPCWRMVRGGHMPFQPTERVRNLWSYIYNLFFFILKCYHICLSQVYQKGTPVRYLTRNYCLSKTSFPLTKKRQVYSSSLLLCRCVKISQDLEGLIRKAVIWDLDWTYTVLTWQKR